MFGTVRLVLSHAAHKELLHKSHSVPSAEMLNVNGFIFFCADGGDSFVPMEKTWVAMPNDGIRSAAVAGLGVASIVLTLVVPGVGFTFPAAATCIEIVFAGVATEEWLVVGAAVAKVGLVVTAVGVRVATVCNVERRRERK